MRTRAHRHARTGHTDIQTHVHVYVCAYHILTYIHKHVYSPVHMYMHTHGHGHGYTHMDVHARVHATWTWTCIYTHACICVCAHTYTHVLTCREITTRAVHMLTPAYRCTHADSYISTDLGSEATHPESAPAASGRQNGIKESVGTCWHPATAGTGLFDD